MELKDFTLTACPTLSPNAATQLTIHLAPCLEIELHWLHDAFSNHSTKVNTTDKFSKLQLDLFLFNPTTKQKNKGSAKHSKLKSKPDMAVGK